MHELLHKIQKTYKSLTQAQKLVADYILCNHSQIPFMTITSMAHEIGVSDTTIIKFCSILGYNSFSSFKKVFIKHVQSELAIYNNFENRMEDLDKKDTIDQVFSIDQLNIKTTLTRPTNKENFVPFLDMLDAASSIYIYGMRSSSILMNFLTQSLRIQGYNVISTAFYGHFIEQLSDIKQEDLFISFAFSRYSKESVQALRFVADRNIPNVAFTDSPLSPTFLLADLGFICEARSYTYQASYVGVLSLLNAIITETTLRNRNRIKKNIKDIESTFEYFNTFTDEF